MNMFYVSVYHSVNHSISDKKKKRFISESIDRINNSIYAIYTHLLFICILLLLLLLLYLLLRIIITIIIIIENIKIFCHD